MKILITGGTGFLGTHLTDSLLKDGHEVVIVSRRERSSSKKGVSFAKWDGKSISTDVGPVDAVVNLAGAGIADKKWTDAYKHLVKQSRIDASQACVNFIWNQTEKPAVFLAGSAIGYYGGDREGQVDETSSPGTDFMADVCKTWEEASEGAGIRTVFLRTGVIFGKDDGPLPVMIKPFQFFVGGPIGDGKQYLPWMHVEDWVAAVRFLMENESVSGPVILTAPKPETNAVFSKYVASILSRPNLFKVPKFALNTLLGEQAIIAWGSMNAQPEVLKANGFKFQFPELKGALKNLLG